MEAHQPFTTLRGGYQGITWRRASRDSQAKQESSKTEPYDSETDKGEIEEWGYINLVLSRKRMHGGVTDTEKGRRESWSQKPEF